jgi:hypothetical protein
LLGRPDQFDGIGRRRAAIGRLMSELHSFVVACHGHEPLPAAAPHDPRVAEESADGDVLADNVNDEFVCGRSAYFWVSAI